MDERLVRLSKKMAVALRHHPEKFGLRVDEYGFVSLDKLFTAFKNEQNWKDLQIDEFEQVIEQSDKERYQIVGNEIRALYGHSIPVKIKKDKVIPPNILYHGTSIDFLDSIMEKGLLRMGRQYVHLSKDIETAENVGKRKKGKTILLVIDAGNAYNNGVTFYFGNDSIVLADFIPKDYISVK